MTVGVSNLRVLEECLPLCSQKTCKHVESQLVRRTGNKCSCQDSSGWAADCLCEGRKYPSISSGWEADEENGFVTVSSAALCLRLIPIWEEKNAFLH